MTIKSVKIFSPNKKKKKLGLIRQAEIKAEGFEKLKVSIICIKLILGHMKNLGLCNFGGFQKKNSIGKIKSQFNFPSFI